MKDRNMIPVLRYEYPLPSGGCEYSFGEFVWSVVQGPVGGWKITVEAWGENLELAARVMVRNYVSQNTAERALLANDPPLYMPTGAPFSENAEQQAPTRAPATPEVAGDRDLVLAFRPDAMVETRPNSRTHRPESRIICAPGAGKRPDLRARCNTPDLAWRAACLNLGLRFRHCL